MLTNALIPVILALITVGGGVVAYIYQKRIDSSNAHLELRRAAYVEFLQSVTNQTDIGTAQTLNAYHQSQARLFLVAPDGVVRSAGAFQKYMNETSQGQASRDRGRVTRLIVTTVREMRQDCFSETSLSDDELISLAPF
jgi:hypothetical protein